MLGVPASLAPAAVLIVARQGIFHGLRFMRANMVRSQQAKPEVLPGGTRHFAQEALWKSASTRTTACLHSDRAARGSPQPFGFSPLDQSPPTYADYH